MYLFWVLSNTFGICCINSPLCLTSLSSPAYTVYSTRLQGHGIVQFGGVGWGSTIQVLCELSHLQNWFITISTKWLSKFDVKVLELTPNDQFFFKNLNMYISNIERELAYSLFPLCSFIKICTPYLPIPLTGHRLLSQSAHEAVSRSMETTLWCQSKGRVTLMQIPWLLTKQAELILNDFYSWGPLSGLFLTTVSPFQSHIFVNNIMGSWIQIARVLRILGRLTLVF